MKYILPCRWICVSVYSIFSSLISFFILLLKSLNIWVRKLQILFCLYIHLQVSYIINFVCLQMKTYKLYSYKECVVTLSCFYLFGWTSHNSLQSCLDKSCYVLSQNFLHSLLYEWIEKYEILLLCYSFALLFYLLKFFSKTHLNCLCLHLISYFI